MKQGTFPSLSTELTQGSYLVESPADIRNLIFDMFEANGQTNQPFGNAERRPFFRGETHMGRGRRMGDQTAGITEIVGNLDQFQAR